MKEQKTMNFSAGTPLDVLQAYEGESKENPIYEACIGELRLGKCQDLSKLKVLCVSDTSGSMERTNYGTTTPFDVCCAMTAFFSMCSPTSYRNKFIQFAGRAFIRDLNEEVKEEPSFFDFIKYMGENRIYDMTTNFESVLAVLKELFTGVESSELPDYLIFWSDMQFNRCVQSSNQDLTAAELLEKLFVEELDFKKDDVPTIVFWNLNAHDNRPARASDQGVVMLSGYNPQMLLELDAVIKGAVSDEEFEEAERKLAAEAESERLRQEEEKRINTWKAMVQILTSSEATVPFLEKIKSILPHTLLDEVNEDSKSSRDDDLISDSDSTTQLSCSESEVESQTLSNSSRSNSRRSVSARKRRNRLKAMKRKERRKK